MSNPVLTFETAALADVMARAARVAPHKGSAFDKAAGIIVEYRPTDAEPVTIKSTDFDVTFLERITPLGVTAGAAAFTWRIPSALAAGITGNLPLGSQTEMSLDTTGALLIKCGKSKAKIRLYGDPTTNFEPFDPSGLVLVPGFAERVSQVAWACDKQAIPFTGVHIDGKRLVATDRYRLVTVPLDVPVTDPITVPLDALTLVSKGGPDARIAAVNRRLHVMPTEYTQVTAVIYDAAYPKVDRGMYRDHDKFCTVGRELLKTAISKMLVLVKGERYPLMTLTVGTSRIHVLIDVPEIGIMEDEIDVVGADHPDFVVTFTPNNFVDGVSHAGKEEIKFSYDTRDR